MQSLKWKQRDRHSNKPVNSDPLPTGCAELGRRSGGGMDAYERGDYDTALKDFRLLAEQGEAEAQLALGLQVPATVSLNVSDDGLAAIGDIDILNQDALLSVLPHLV